MTMRVDESEIQGPRRFPPPIALVCTVSIFQCRFQFTFDYLHPGLLEARSLTLIWFQAPGYSFCIFSIPFLIDFLVHLSQGPTQWPVTASGPIRLAPLPRSSQGLWSSMQAICLFMNWGFPSLGTNTSSCWQGRSRIWGLEETRDTSNTPPISRLSFNILT